MNPILISPLAPTELNSFFRHFDFSTESKHLQEYVSLVKETSLCYQTIIHEAYYAPTEAFFGFIALRTTNGEVEGVPGILVEFLYLKQEYRSKTEELTNSKYSHLLLDYIIETALMLQKQVAINHVYLVPINEKVRKLYNDYGFVNLPDSGKNQYEDYMVFNLLDEDPTIV